MYNCIELKHFFHFRILKNDKLLKLYTHTGTEQFNRCIKQSPVLVKNKFFL